MSVLYDPLAGARSLENFNMQRGVLICGQRSQDVASWDKILLQEPWYGYRSPDLVAWNSTFSFKVVFSWVFFWGGGLLVFQKQILNLNWTKIYVTRAVSVVANNTKNVMNMKHCTGLTCMIFVTMPNMWKCGRWNMRPEGRDNPMV